MEGARGNCSRLPGAAGRLVLQPLWDRLRAGGRLQSPLFPLLFALGAYVGCCLPFVLLDLLCPWVPALRRAKLHSDPAPRAPQLLRCLGATALRLAGLLLPLWALSPALSPAPPPAPPARAPELPRLLLHVALCLLLFDAQVFAWHLLQHRLPWLYRHVHRLHHRHRAPSALTTQHASLWELGALGLLHGLPPALLGCHPLSALAFHLLNTWLAVDAHAAYDFPWSPHRLLPGWYGGAAHHHLHHLHFNCNFAPYFTHWDRALGTLQAARRR